MRHWIYHKTEQPRIANVGDPFEDGWSEHPPGLLTTDFGIDKDDIQGVQMLGETIEGMKDCLNGALNLEFMLNKELREFAQFHFGKKIKGKKVYLIAQIEQMFDGKSH